MIANKYVSLSSNSSLHFKMMFLCDETSRNFVLLTSFLVLLNASKWDEVWVMRNFDYTEFDFQLLFGFTCSNAEVSREYVIWISTRQVLCFTNSVSGIVITVFRFSFKFRCQFYGGEGSKLILKFFKAHASIIGFLKSLFPIFNSLPPPEKSRNTE